MCQQLQVDYMGASERTSNHRESSSVKRDFKDKRCLRERERERKRERGWGREERISPWIEPHWINLVMDCGEAYHLYCLCSSLPCLLPLQLMFLILSTLSSSQIKYNLVILFQLIWNECLWSKSKDGICMSS